MVILVVSFCLANTKPMVDDAFSVKPDCLPCGIDDNFICATFCTHQNAEQFFFLHINNSHDSNFFIQVLCLSHLLDKDSFVKSS